MVDVFKKASPNLQHLYKQNREELQKSDVLNDTIIKLSTLHNPFISFIGYLIKLSKISRIPYEKNKVDIQNYKELNLLQLAQNHIFDNELELYKLYKHLKSIHANFVETYEIIFL